MHILCKSIILCSISLSFAACGANSNSSKQPTQTEQTKLSTLVLDGDEGDQIAFPLHPTRRLANADTNLAGMSFFEIEIAANSPGAPPHTHSHEDEFFYVRQGRVTFLTGDSQKTIGAGGFTLLPRHSLHAVWNASDQDAILLVGTSKGEFGDFFDTVAIAAREETPQTPQDMGALLGRISAERGIVIDMSKVPANVAALYGLPPQ